MAETFTNKVQKEEFLRKYQPATRKSVKPGQGASPMSQKELDEQSFKKRGRK